MKNISFAIQKTAADLNLPEEQVKVVVMEYWREITNQLIGLKSTTVTARHLGSFTISRFKLYNLIRKHIEKARKIQASPYITEEQRMEEMEKLYLRLRPALEKRNELAILYATKFKNI